MIKRSKFADKIVGPPDVFSLEDRSLNAILFVALLISVLSVFGDSIQELGTIQVLYALSMTIALGIMYNIGRKSPNYKKLIIPFIIIELTAPLFGWYFLGGISGTSLLFAIVLILTFPILIKGNGKYYLFIGMILLFGFLLYFEIANPDFVIHYRNKDSQLIDKYLTAIFVSAGAFILMNLLIVSYRVEQEKNKALNEDLNKYNEELSAHSKELIKHKESIMMRDEALKNELKFRGIFNSSNDGILISDKDGNILEANQSISKLLAIPIDQLKQMKTSDLVPDRYVKDILQRAKKVVNNEDVPLIEIPLMNRAWQFLTLELNTISMDYKNEKVLLSLVRDITLRKETERKILKSVIKAEERERSHFAKEIHDGIGPLLSAIKIYADAFRDVKNEKDKDFAISKLNEMVHEAIRSAKEISNNLSPHVLKNFGIKGAIEAFYRKIDQGNQIKFIFKSNIEDRLNEEIEFSLYRIVVELINNSMKYAEPTIIFIELMKYAGIIALAYSDNGKGFDFRALDEKSTGMGLANIRSRIKSLDGKLKMWSEPGKGFKADLRIDPGLFNN